MALSRWGALSVAVQRFINALAETPQTEHVGLVSYGSNYTACSVSNNSAEINCNLASNHAAVTAAMGGISAKKFNGMTNIGAGITKGIQVLNSVAARPYAAKTMVLMSDGAYTEGTQPSLIAPQAAEHDIIIHTITFGEANPAEMQAIADATGGNHYIAPDAATLQEIFEEIALTLPVVFTD
jgi:Ca-activated chloride channel family protein